MVTSPLNSPRGAHHWMNGKSGSWDCQWWLRKREGKPLTEFLSQWELNLFFLLQTASTLVVAEAKASGIYSCVASNKVGKSERNVSFIVTGKIYSSVESNMFPDPGIMTVGLLRLFNVPHFQNFCIACTCKLIPCFWVMLVGFTAVGLDF